MMTRISRCFKKICISLLLSSASKSFELDPIPTNILKLVSDIILPVVTIIIIIIIINKPLAESSVPSSFKHAIVRPLLKKQGLDTEVFKDSCPVPNLPFISKFWKKWSVHALSIILYQTICKILTNLHTAYIILQKQLF